MRAHILQHAPFEGLGHIATWLAGRQATTATTRLFAGDALPDRLDGIDLVVAMGGPMSVNDEDALPWLGGEKRFVREVLDRGIPLLGVCLGAQLIASALGSRVYPNAEREVGWLPVRGVRPPGPDPFTFPAEFTAFHWHGETFDLPPGAVRLAESEGCLNQAFQVGARAIGVQFHLEMSNAGACLLTEHCAGDLAPGRYVQSADAIRAHDAARSGTAHAQMNRLLDYLLRDDAAPNRPGARPR